MPDRTTAELLSLAVESIADYAIFLLDATGHVMTWNLGAQRVKGYTRDEIVGRHFSIFYPQEALDRNWPEHELAVARAEGRFEEESWRLRKDGSRFWANVVITALRDEHGEVIAFAKVTRDLTERKLHEERLRQSEERFRLLVEGVRDYAIFMLDLEGHIQSWNVGAQEISGYAPAEVIGRHFSIFYTQDDKDRRWPDRELDMARTDGRYEEEGLRVRKDGTTYWSNVVITALYDHDGRLRGYAKVTRDLTDRKRVEELEQVQTQTNEFLAMLAHELRNPLAPIVSSIDVLSRKPAPDAESEAAQRILQRQARQLTRLVNDLLDVSRVVKSAIPLERRPVEVASVVRHAAEASEQWVRERGQTLAVDLCAEPLWVKGDEQRLEQAVVNLLNNAAKYTPHGGRIAVSCRREGTNAVVSVKDTGSGIAGDLLPKVFDLFVQGERTIDRSQGGLGLGLALVKRLVMLHGGTVAALSAGPNMGSEFIVRLPTVSAPADAAQARERRAAPGPRTRRILVVDDNVDAAEMLAVILSVDGHTVRAVHSGAEAIATVDAFRPEVVFLDIGMPGMNGYEVARRLRALPQMSGSLLIALTGYGQSTGAARGNEAEFDHHIVKPASIEQIRSVLPRNGNGNGRLAFADH